MIRPDVFLLGYFVYTIEDKDIARVAELFMKRGVSVRFDKNTFVISARKAKLVESILDTRVKFSRSEMQGLGGFLHKNRKRWGAFSAIAVTVILLMLSSTLVWDVRIEGCESGREDEIKRELAACGFSVGSVWSDSDLSEIEVKLLASSDCVSWVNINRRGTVAYVTVMDKIAHDPPEQKLGYSNVVSACDAVIEEITVLRGVAAVKAGDSVKAGDLLISGVIPDELGGGYCYAEGVVIGRVSDTVEVSVSEISEEKYLTETKLSCFNIKFFGFSVNILKSGRNSDVECDIIEKTDALSLFGVSLPISVTREYSAYYTPKEVLLTADEMTARASESMSALLSEKLGQATLLRIRTEGQFAESYYFLKTHLVFTKEIGEDLPFEVSP